MVSDELAADSYVATRCQLQIGVASDAFFLASKDFGVPKVVDKVPRLLPVVTGLHVKAVGNRTCIGPCKEVSVLLGHCNRRLKYVANPTFTVGRLAMAPVMQQQWNQLEDI